MEAKKFNRENYIHVPGFAIVDLELSGNDLLCYSLIYGFTQDGETEFNGSLNYVASALNVTKQNAKKIIDRLIDRGLVEKREIYFSGVKFCKYVATITALLKQQRGVAETATPPGIETATNNNIDFDNNKDNNIAADGGLFDSQDDFQTVTVTRPRRTSENLCLFENSKFYNFNLFAAEFQAEEFKGVDLVYYYHALADWSSQKGKKMRDWIATVRGFMRRDSMAGKLVKVKEQQSSEMDARMAQYLKEMGE